MDDVKIYNRALSATEVQELYSGIENDYTALFDDSVAYYDFHNDTKDLINGNDGTVTGATLTTNRFGMTNTAYDFLGGSTVSTVDTGVALDTSTLALKLDVFPSLISG